MFDVENKRINATTGTNLLSRNRVPSTIASLCRLNMLPPFTNPGSQNELHLSNQPQIPENGPKSKKQLGLSRPSRRCLYLLASTRPQKLLTTRRRPPPLRLVLHDEPLGWCPQVFSRRLSSIACSRTRPETLETK